MSIIKGLNNMGNTCYLNAGLQMLIQNKDFCQIISESTDQEIMLLSKFIKDYYNKNNNNSLSPEIVKNIVVKRNNMFRGFSQEDSSEFIIFFIDYINSKTNNQINKLFKIKSKQTIKCKVKSCLTLSNSFDENNYLILPINPEHATLDDCYREYKIHEKLEDKEMYFCDNCKEKRIASRKVEIIDWSTHLIIILKRYNNNLKKIDKSIDIPLLWRRGYELKGAVIQSGSLNGGHYIYVGKTIEEDGSTNWKLCDDGNIYKIDESRAQLYFNRAIILYYKK